MFGVEDECTAEQFLGENAKKQKRQNVQGSGPRTIRRQTLCFGVFMLLLFTESGLTALLADHYAGEMQGRQGTRDVVTFWLLLSRVQ